MLKGLNEKRQLLTALLVTTGLSCFSAAALAAPVYLDPATNLEWRQVEDTVGYSYETMNTGGVIGCSASTGECAGLLGGSGPSLDGWTWATELEVRTLFHNFSGSLNIAGFDPLPSTPDNFREYDSLWASSILDTDGDGYDDGIFDATRLPGYGDLDSELKGYTRTLSPYDSSFAYGPKISQDYTGDNLGDFAGTNVFANISSSLPERGFWLFRPAPAPVPEPSTILLLGLGLAGLAGVRRKLKD